MTVAAIRETIIADIEVSDEKLLGMISALIAEYRAPEKASFGAERDKKIAETRVKHLRRESRSYSTEEVRQMAISKTLPSEFEDRS